MTLTQLKRNILAMFGAQERRPEPMYLTGTTVLAWMREAKVPERTSDGEPILHSELYVVDHRGIRRA